MDKKQNPLTATIFMIIILCAFVVVIPIVLIVNQQALTMGYLAILLLMMAMALLYVTLRGVLRRIETLEGKSKPE